MKASIIKRLSLGLTFSKPVFFYYVLSQLRILKPLSLLLFSLYSTTGLAFDYFVVNRDAEVYSAPDSSELLTRLSKGNVLLEIDKKGAWSRVFFLTPDKQPLKGWMLSDRLTAQQQEKSSPKIVGYTHTVAVDSLRLRQGPGGNYTVVGSLRRDQQVSELKREGDWVNVGYRNEAGNLENAWTAGRFLKPIAAQSVTTSVEALAGQYRVSGEKVNFRSGPGTGYRVVGKVSAPQLVTVIERRKDWMKIRVEENGVSLSGWIAQRFLEPVN